METVCLVSVLLSIPQSQGKNIPSQLHLGGHCWFGFLDFFFIMLVVILSALHMLMDALPGELHPSQPVLVTFLLL